MAPADMRWRVIISLTPLKTGNAIGPGSHLMAVAGFTINKAKIGFIHLNFRTVNKIKEKTQCDTN